MQDVARTFGYTRSAVLLKDEDTNELVIPLKVRGRLIGVFNASTRTTKV